MCRIATFALLLLTLTLHLGCTSSTPVPGGVNSAGITGSPPSATKLPDMSQARDYSIYHSNINLHKLGGERFDFNPTLLKVVGNTAAVTIGTMNVGSLTADQRAHTAMKAALDIQRATGAESVLLYLSLGEDLPKIFYSAAMVAYSPAGRDWNDGAGVQVWDVEVSDVQVDPEAIRLAQEAKRLDSNVALPIPMMYRKDYVPGRTPPANGQKSLEAQLFERVDNFILEEDKEHPYNVEAAKALIERGANVNARDDGQTPLIRAAQRGHIEVAKVLLEHGADVNARDDDGQTALMHAAGSTDPDMVQLLLAKGADVNLKDKDGDTVWSRSEMIGGGGSDEPEYIRMRRLLKRAGAK